MSRLVGRSLLLAAVLCGAATVVQAGFPWYPHYPHENYPSVLDARHGYGPAPVYGFAGPSYRWGWFGAQYRPRMASFQGYRGAYQQTGFRWGYDAVRVRGARFRF